MVALVWHTLRRLRWHIIGWSLGMAYMGSLIIIFADNLASQMALMEKLLNSMPEGMMDFFGGLEGFATPAGFIDGKLFSQLPIMLGIFAIIVGAGLVVSDEENGMMDILLGRPISRSTLFFSRVLGVILASIIILVAGAMSAIIPLAWVDIGISADKMMLAFLPAWVQVLFFLSLTLFLSMILPSQKIAASVAGVYLIFGYVIDGMANITDKLSTVAIFSPMKYYQGGAILLDERLRWDWLAGVFFFAVLFALLAWRKFLTRDLRVRGEGSWYVPTGNGKRAAL